MRIDEQLNLVIPIDRADGTTIWVHAAPIGREAFQRYWLPLSKTFALIYGEGLHLAGPRIAALSLRKVSEDMGVWDGPMGVARGLMPEIRRLANVVAPGDGNGAGHGWQMVPYDDALRSNLLDQDDADEVEGVLVFFTLAWRLHRQKERKDLIDGLCALWGASTSSASLSEFADTLKTSTATGNTGATPPEASSPPSSIGPPARGSSSVLPSAPMTFLGAQVPSSASVI
jgi:hypothetical protein